MNLDSMQDIILLRNCLVVKIKDLKLNMYSPNVDLQTQKKTLACYETLLEQLNHNATEQVNILLKSSDLVEFSQHIFSTPAKEIAKEYMDLTKQMLIKHHAYSEEKFEALTEAFFKNNETLNPTYIPPKESLETDEPSPHLTKDMQINLQHLKKLIRQNPKHMSSSDFKNFSSQFRDLAKNLGIQKFQQYFSTIGQTILDMKISTNIHDESFKPIYQTDFTLSTKDSSDTQHFTYQEPAPQSDFTTTYYQNLCYFYIESNKCANTNEILLSPDVIANKMRIFTKCYEKLAEMLTKCKITFSHHSLFYSSESDLKPSDLNLQACNSIPEIIDDRID